MVVVGSQLARAKKMASTRVRLAYSELYQLLSLVKPLHILRIYVSSLMNLSLILIFKVIQSG